MCEEFIQMVNDNGLLQMQKEPTRESSILDLYLTNKPGPVKHNTTIPGISDHHMVVVDSDVKPTINRKQPRKIFKFSKADWTKVSQDTVFYHRLHDNWSALNTMLTLC